MSQTNLGQFIILQNNYHKIIVIVEIISSGKIYYGYRIVIEKQSMAMNRPRLSQTM